MVKFYKSIPDHLREWAMQQQVFYTASAPSYGQRKSCHACIAAFATFVSLIGMFHAMCYSPSPPYRARRMPSCTSYAYDFVGLPARSELGPDMISPDDGTADVNVSPKGLPSSTFSIFSGNSAAYIDGTGSGCETISHVYDNGRVTIMFCSFAAAPRIMRFFCRGTVIEWHDRRFEDLIERMGKGKIEGARAVILLDIFKVQTSCGYGVPFLATSEERPHDDKKHTDISTSTPYPILKDRDTMGHWAHKKIAANELFAYQADNNASSLDGLPGLKSAIRDHGEEVAWATVRYKLRKLLMAQREGMAFGFVVGIIMAWIIMYMRARYT